MTLTYSELKTAIQDFTENDEATFVSQLDLFIKTAEENMLKNVRLNLFQKNQAGTMTIGNPYLGIPSDFLSPLSISIDNGTTKEFLEFKELDYIQAYSPDTTVTGTPKYYGQFDLTNFTISPTPDTAFVTDIHYVYRPASLTAGTEAGTTWLSINAETTLLYGALLEAYIFMKGEPDVLNEYKSKFMEGLGRVKNLGEGMETTDDYRAGKVRSNRT